MLGWGQAEGAATSGERALVDISCPALGLSPNLSLFPEWFVCELAHLDRSILPLSHSWSRTTAAWPPVTVNCGPVCL